MVKCLKCGQAIDHLNATETASTDYEVYIEDGETEPTWEEDPMSGNDDNVEAKCPRCFVVLFSGNRSFVEAEVEDFLNGRVGNG